MNDEEDFVPCVTQSLIKDTKQGYKTKIQTTQIDIRDGNRCAETSLQTTTIKRLIHLL